MAELNLREKSVEFTELKLPDDVAHLVGDIEPLNRWSSATEAIDNVAKIAEVQDKRFKLQRVLDIWSDYHSHERDLRKSVAKWVFRALFAEIGVSIVLMFLIGIRWLHVDRWVADVFFTAVFSQASAMAYWIVKSLFPAPQTDPLSQINDIVSKL